MPISTNLVNPDESGVGILVNGTLNNKCFQYYKIRSTKKYGSEVQSATYWTGINHFSGYSKAREWGELLIMSQI